MTTITIQNTDKGIFTMGRIFILIALLLPAFLLFMSPQQASAAVDDCQVISDENGALTNSVDFAAGSYDTWVRVKKAGGGASVTVSVDGAGGSQCNTTITSSASNNDWSWVKAGAAIAWSANSPARVQVTGADGVGLDCVVFTQEATFAPSTAADCEAGDDSQPVIRFSSAESKATGSSHPLSLSIPQGSDVDRVEYIIDGEVVGTVNATPFTYNLLVSADDFSNGDYSVIARVYDSSGSSQDIDPALVRVRLADINRDSTVNLRDILEIITKWNPDGQDRPSNAEADLNLDGNVNLQDILEVILNWSR